MKINWLGLAFLFFSAASFSNEFDTKLSGSEVCTEIRQAMSAALAKDQHPLSGLKTNIDAIEGGMLELDDDPALNRLSEKRQNRVAFDIFDVDQDGEVEVLIRTDVALGRAGQSHRQYYFLDGLENRNRKSIKDQLSNVLWINKKGLALPSLIRYPVLFPVDGNESDVISFEETHPFIFSVGDHYYIYITKAHYIGVLLLEGVDKASPHCLYKW